MIKMVLVFLIAWVLISCAINVVYNSTWHERLSIAKVVLYGGVTAFLAVVVLTGFVLLF